MISLLAAGAFLLIYWFTAWTIFLTLAKICGVIAVFVWVIIIVVGIIKGN